MQPGEEYDVEEGYKTGLDGENRHVAGVDYPACNQDEKYEEKIENVPVDIASARRLTISYHEADRAY